MIARTPLLALTTVSILLAQGPAQGPARKPLPDEMLKRVRPVIDALYRLDYPPAEALTLQLIRDFPDNPAGYVYRERVYFSQELSKARLVSAARVASMDLFSDSPKFTLPVPPEIDARFRRAADEAIEKGRVWLRLHPGDVAGQYLLGSAYAFKSAYEFSIRHSRLSASEDASRTFKILSGLMHSNADIVDAKALTGAFSIVADSLDFKTRLVAALLLGIHGDLAGGRRDMEDASQRGFIENDDAQLLLSIEYTREKNFDRAKILLTQLYERYPENYLLPLELAAVELISGKPADAITLYREILAKNYPGLERCIVLARLGAAARIMGDPVQSERWLREAASVPGASGPSVAIARLELGKTLDLAGQRAAAVEQYRLVQRGEDFLDIRRDAELWLRKPYDRDAMDHDNRGGGLISLH